MKLKTLASFCFDRSAVRIVISRSWVPILGKRLQGYNSQREGDMCTTKYDALCWLGYEGFQMECGFSIRIHQLQVSNWNIDVATLDIIDSPGREDLSVMELYLKSQLLCVKLFLNWLGHVDFWQVQNRKPRPSWLCALRQPSATI